MMDATTRHAPTIAVIGAGVAGLTAAYRLQQAGCAVRVFESEAEVGGRMSCRRIDGYTLNRAATLLNGSYDFLLNLIAELGLRDRITYADFKIGTLRDGRVYPVRTNHVLWDSVFSGLLSFRSKLLMARLMRDVRRVKQLMRYDDLGLAAGCDIETAEAYALRRLNRELCDYVVDPAMAALLVSRAGQPSVVDLFFTVANYLGAGAYYVDGGIDFLVRELAQRLSVTTGSRVDTVDESGDGVHMHWQENGSSCDGRFDGAVIATSAHAVAPMCPQLSDEQRRILASYEYVTILVGHFGLSRPPTGIDADFVQIPFRENAEVANLLLAHRQQRGMAPPGKGLVVAYYRDEWSEARFDHDHEQLRTQMTRALEPLVPGIAETTEMFNLERWRPALFKSHAGSYSAMAAMRRSLDGMNRVQLAGDYFSFTSTNASAISGDAAARRLLTRLGLRAAVSG